MLEFFLRSVKVKEPNSLTAAGAVLGKGGGIFKYIFVRIKFVLLKSKSKFWRCSPLCFWTFPISALEIVFRTGALGPQPPAIDW